MEEDIVRLIRMYEASAKNLRNVADIADSNDPTGESAVARTSRAKADTYDLVRRDLEMVIENSKGT
jgi:hypothetical protein